MLLDRQGRCLTSNRPGLMMMKISSDEVVGRQFRNIWPPEVWPIIDENVQKVLAGENCTFDAYRMNGLEIGWWEMRMAPLFNDKGEVDQFIAISSNITERKLNEEALRESTERFRQLSDLLPVAIYEADLNGKITYINRTAFDCFGLGQEDFENGLTGYDFIAPPDRLRAMTNVDKIIEGAENPSTEYLAQRKDGSTFPAIFRTSVKTHNGKPDGFRGVVVDISEKKLLEERLLHAQKMEAIGTLAGGIAHDFNNILSAVIGYADLGKLILNPENPVCEYLDEIHVAGVRATKLIKQILAFSRQGDEDFFPVQIKSIVKEVIKMLKSTIPANIEIRQEIDPQCEDILIMADQALIYQVLMNLSTNAYQAVAAKGGVLEVCLSRTVLDDGDAILRELSITPGAYLTLAVKDNGPGIDKDLMQKIFEPYFTTKKRGEGTGLGLAVVLGIVQKHRGGISVDSQPGKETTFTIYLPITQSSTSSIKTESVLHIPGGDERILFVDDENAIVAVNERSLTILGYEMTCSTSSTEALRLFEQDPQNFDLIITDMAMPQMSGAELVQRVKEIRPDIPVIMCTGYSETMNQAKARSLGISEFIMKPIIFTDLAKTIRKLL